MRPYRQKSFDGWLAQPPSATSVIAETNRNLPVLVVGAGPAGLAAMAGLHRAGVSFLGIEAHRQVGGIWDQSNPLSSVYDGMQTNTSRHTTHLGEPMPADWPAYPHSSQAHAYLASFAEGHQLLPHIECSTRYVGAQKTSRGTWNVTLRHGSDQSAVGVQASACSRDGSPKAVLQQTVAEREFRAVVFATGVHHRERHVVPQQLWDEAIASGFDVRHSSHYRSAEEFAGKRVLIVGIGNSGSDIADMLSRVASRVVLAVRSTPWIVPSVVFGRPSDQLADDTTSWLPHWIQMASFHFIQRLYIGHPTKLGLSTPQYQLLEKFAITDRGIVQAIREGRVTIRSNVTSLRDGVAAFAKADEAPEPFDAVIFATGYNRGYPLLDAGKESDLSEALAFLIFHRTEPGLAYMAETIATRGCWPIFAEQGRALAAYFAAEQRGSRNVAEFNARRSLASPDFKGKLFRKADGFHVDFHRYTRALRDLTAWLER